ncbi:hypothetical protein Vi05172_g8276 [Venturia inaequalis]|nr:hypothetical protein Vi05172_g8276 [Venturia inaequalis]
MPGTRSEDSTPRIRPSISPINSPMPPTEYSIAERPAREDSPDRRYYNDRAASRSRSRSRSPKESRSRRKSTDYRERSTSAPAWAAPERPKTLDYQPTLVLKGHKKAISAVKFSPDGKRIASCSADGTIKIWDAFTGEHEHTLEGHMAGISAIAWSPDSTTIASGSDDKSIRLWDAIKGKAHPNPFLGHHNYVFSLQFSPKGNMLVSGSYDEAVFLWDVRAARVMRSLPAHSDPVGGVDFVRDGTLIGAFNSRLWDTATGQCLRTIVHEDNKPVVGVRFSPNGKYVLAWTLDNCIRLWNYVEGRCLKTYCGGKDAQAYVNSKYSLGGAFGTYGTGDYPFAFIASGSENGSIFLWDVSTKTVLQRIEGAHEGVVLGVDTHPTEPLIVSGGADRTVRLWRFDSSRSASTKTVDQVEG